MRIPLFILLFLILAVDRRLRLHVHLRKGVQQLIWGQVGGGRRSDDEKAWIRCQLSREFEFDVVCSYMVSS